MLTCVHVFYLFIVLHEVSGSGEEFGQDISLADSRKGGEATQGSLFLIFRGIYFVYHYTFRHVNPIIAFGLIQF